MASDIDRIRNEVSLPDLAAGYGVRLEKDGGEHLGCCPFHSEDTASFTIFTGKDKVQRFHCFGCGEMGDALDFVQGIKGVNLKEAIAILGGKTAGPNIAPRKVDVRDVYEGIEPLQPRQPMHHFRVHPLLAAERSLGAEEHRHRQDHQDVQVGKRGFKHGKFRLSVAGGVTVAAYPR